MSRPAVEVADVLHAQGQHFLDQHPWLSVQLGDYFLLDVVRDSVKQTHVDLESFGRELGVLAAWERLEA